MNGDNNGGGPGGSYPRRPRFNEGKTILSVSNQILSFLFVPY